MAILTPAEKLRRLYRDLVRRRSSVRVISAIEASLEYPPVFIIGLYRSGTTLLRYVIDSHSRICCPPETNFIGLLAPIMNDHSSRVGLESLGFDEDHVVERLREFCVYFFSNYAASWGKPRWADKSTTHVDYLDFILRLFPSAQFIMIYRHGLDQAHSFTRGGTVLKDPLRGYRCEGEDLRIGAARYWCEKMEKIIDFEKRYPEKCTHISYEELCESPEVKLRPIFEFLGERWESEVMEFYKFQHDRGPEHGRVIVTQGFSVHRGYYLNWSPELVEQCVSIVGPVMQSIGYSI